MHSWRLWVTIALMACGLRLLASRHNFHSATVELAFSFVLWVFEFLNCWIVEWRTLCESSGPLASEGFCCCCFVGWLRPLKSSAKLWGTYKNFCGAFFSAPGDNNFVVRPFVVVVCWGWPISKLFRRTCTKTELSFLDEHF